MIPTLSLLVAPGVVIMKTYGDGATNDDKVVISRLSMWLVGSEDMFTWPTWKRAAEAMLPLLIFLPVAGPDGGGCEINSMDW